MPLENASKLKVRELAPADPAIDVTVSIVNWNGVRWIHDCLRALQEAQGPRLEVIFVDNASEDGSVELVRSEFPDVELIGNKDNPGFAAANNQAIRRGRGRYFFILNNDTVLERDCLALLTKFLDEHPEAGMVAGQLVNPDGSIQFAYYPVALPSLASLTADLLWLNRVWPRNRLGRGEIARRWDPKAPFRMEQIPGACMFVRREFLEQVGLFDERYRFWYEDVDLCARGLQSGWQMWYLPQARILHHGGASTKLLQFSSRSLLRFRSMLRYAEKFYTRRQYSLLKLIVVLVLVTRLPIVVGAALWPGKKVRHLWKGTWKAYAQLIGEIVRDRHTSGQQPQQFPA